MKHVNIIGGGLSGLALSISLRRKGVPVTLSEAGDYPRHRVCGEFICGAHSDLFEHLGIAHTIADAILGRQVLWFHRDRPVARFHLPSPAFQISRFRLDQRLAVTFTRAGGILHTRRRYTGPAISPGTVIATGSCSNKNNKSIGLKVHARSLRLDADLEIHFGTRAYVGLCRVEHDQVNVCGLFLHPPACPPRLRPMDRFLFLVKAASLTNLFHTLSNADIDHDSFCGVSRLSFGWQSAPNPSTPRIGDSLALTPPFTGNGMAMAFQSALSATPILHAWAQGHARWEDTSRSLYRHQRSQLSKRLRAATILHPILLSPTWQLPLTIAAQKNLLPFQTLFQLTHY